MKIGSLVVQLPGPTQLRRILLLVALGAGALGIEFGLRGWEQHQRTDADLKRTQSRIALLAQSAEQTDWAQRSAALAIQQEALREQLWRAPTEAQAQGLLRDWLQFQLKSAGIERAQVRLLPLLPAQASTAASAAEAASANVSSELRQAFRVRAQISFDLQPQRLETLLDRIENGGQLAQVDSLNASRRTRRVELIVSLPILVQQTRPAGAGS